ncbi:MAG: hypothetical protein IJI43_01410 [Bacilli bacterium]|nr:hypothetical protein [Bacilli bacterium]
MKTQEKFDKQNVVIVALIIVILLMSIGFAVYSRTLNINGAATFKGSKWSVHFVQDSYHIRENSVTADSVSLNNTMLTYSVTLQEPGDKYEYYVDIINDGTLPAQLNTVTTTVLTEAQSKYMDIEMTYNPNKNNVAYEDFGNGNITLNPPILLATNVTARLNVKVEYKEDVEQEFLPEEDATITLTTNLNYVQNE